MKKIKLYGYTTSPFVRKTACFLYYKGIDFTHIPVNPVDPDATLAHTNGTRVPVLEIDGEARIFAPLSEETRHGWPERLRETPFIRNMVQELDLSESYPAMQQRNSQPLKLGCNGLQNIFRKTQLWILTKCR